MLRDKWGLPRKWPFWRDPLFWAYSAWVLATSLPVWLVMYQSILREIWTLGGLLILLAVAAIYASVYWFIFDSYRWDHPQRWWWLALLLFFWAGALPYYLIKRQLWFDELIARRDKMI